MLDHIPKLQKVPGSEKKSVFKAAYINRETLDRELSVLLGKIRRLRMVLLVAVGLILGRMAVDIGQAVGVFPQKGPITKKEWDRRGRTIDRLIEIGKGSNAVDEMLTDKIKAVYRELREGREPSE